MANEKKGRNKTDEFDFDSFDDLDAFGGDDLFGDGNMKDDRKAITKLRSSVGKGVLDKLKDPRTQINFLKKALPPGYDTAIDTIDSGAAGLKNLYDVAREEGKKTANELKGAVRALLPNDPGYMPEKLHQRLKAWSAEEKRSGQMSDDEIESASIAADLGELFAIQAQEGARQQRTQDAKQQIRDTVNMKLGVQGNQYLKGVYQATSRLASYQDQITLKYQQKNLELQYRQYYVQKRLLGGFEAYAKASNDNMAAIRKNTGLPDWVKMNNVEVVEEIMKRSLFGRLGQGISGWSQGAASRVMKAVASKIKATAASVGTTLAEITQGAQMARGATTMPGVSMQDMLVELLGETAGGWITEKLVGPAAKKMSGFLSRNKKLVNGGLAIKNAAGSSAHLLNSWARSGSERGGLLGWLEGLLKEGVGTWSKDRSVKKSAAGRLDEAAHFNLQTRLAITDVIPGWLSRIHNELRMTRTGDNSLQPMSYDYTRGNFEEASAKKKRIASLVYDEDARKRVNDRTDELMEAFQSDKLSRKDQNVLRKALLTTTESGTFDPNDFVLNGNFGEGVDYDTRQRLMAHVRELTGTKVGFNTTTGRDEVTSMDMSGSGQANIAKILDKFNNLMGAIPDMQAILIDEAMNGNMDELKQMGLVIDDGQGNFNVNPKKLIEFLNGQSDGSSGGGSGPRSLKQRLKQKFRSAMGMGGGSSSAASGGESAPYSSFTSNHSTTDTSRLENLVQGIYDIMHAGSASGAFGEGAAALASQASDLGRRGWQAAQDAFGRARAAMPDVMASARGYAEMAKGKFKDMQSYLRGRGPQARAKFDELVAMLESGSAQGQAKFAEIKQKLMAGSWGSVPDFATIKQYLEGKIDINELRTKLESKASSAGASLTSFGSGMLSRASSFFNRAPGTAGPMSGSEMDRLIETAQAIAVSTETILQLLQSGAFGGGEGSADPVRMLRWRDRIKLGLVNGGINGVGKVLKMGRSMFAAAWNVGAATRNLVVKGGIKGIKFAGKAAMGTMGFAKDLWQGHTSRYKDIYVNGESEPRMIATKMLQGHYRDQKTNKVISRVQDITGAVIDETGNVVLTEEDIAKGLYDKFKKPIAMRLYDIGRKVVGFMGAPYKLAFDLLRATVPRVIAYAKAHKDIYVAGETEPRMLARLIRQGYYKRQLDGKVITGIKDISGVIVDPTGNVVLTTEDINKGLVDKNGNKIRTMGEKLGGLVGSGFKLAGNGIKMLGKGIVNAMSFMKNFFGQGWEVIKGMLGGFSLLGYSKPIKDELVKIRTILDERLPGKKKRRILGDSDGDGTREGSAADQAAKRDAAAEKGEGRNFRKMLAGLFSRNKDGKEGKNGFEGIGLKTLLGGLLGGVGGLIKSITGLIPGFGMIGKALGLIGKLGLGAGKLAWGATKLGVKGALGVGRLAIQGAGWAAGGMASMMGFSGVGAMLGAAASGVGAILASPVVLTAAALAAVGYGAWKIYKYVSRPRTWLTQFRMVQYGFKPRDNDELLSKIITLENYLLKFVTVSEKGGAKIGNGISGEELRGIFGVDANDEVHMREFLAWSQYRFKPVFLSHCTILHQMTKTLDLQKIDDTLDTAQKLDYILKVHFPNDDKSPYHVGSSPFKDEEIQESAADVAEAYGDFRDQIQKDRDKHDSKIKEQKRRDALTPEQRAKEDAAKKAEEQKSWYNKSKEGASALAKASMDKLRAAGNWGKDLYNSAVNKTSQAWDATKAAAGTVATYAGQGLGMAGVPGAVAGAAYGTYKVLKGDAKKNREAMFQAMREMGVTSPMEQAMIMANVDNETGGFTTMVENLNYKADTIMKLWPARVRKNGGAAAVAAAVAQGPMGIAEFLYGNRSELRNIFPGDGAKYIGRGMLQITGRANYEAAGQALGIDLVNNPELAADPVIGAKIAIWWLRKYAGKELMESGDIRRVRKIANGGTIGMEHVVQKFNQYLPMAQAGKLLPPAPGTPPIPPAAAIPNVPGGTPGAKPADPAAGAKPAAPAATPSTPAKPAAAPAAATPRPAAAPTASAPRPVTTDPKTVANQNAATAATVASASKGSTSIGTTTSMEATNGILSKQLDVQITMRDLLSEIRDLTITMNTGNAVVDKATAGKGAPSSKPTKPSPKAPVNMGTQ